MTKFVILMPIIVSVFLITNCTNKSNNGQSEAALTEEQARDLSPVGEVCFDGEIESVFVPSNRGRGNSRGEYQDVDNRVFEPAFLYGDVDNDGVAGTRDDAALATTRIYKKQIESEPCPAVADIGVFGEKGKFGADTWFTSEDIYQWRQVAKTGIFQGLGQIICQSKCAIQNHMAPGFKK